MIFAPDQAINIIAGALLGTLLSIPIGLAIGRYLSQDTNRQLQMIHAAIRQADLKTEQVTDQRGRLAGLRIVSGDPARQPWLENHMQGATSETPLALRQPRPWWRFWG